MTAANAAPPPPTKSGGLLLREGPRLYFLPASVAVRIDAMPAQVVRVPGGPGHLLGIATHEGEVLPVVTIGEDRSTMVVCRFAGELLGLVGAKVERTGFFEPSPADGGAVHYEGERAETIDLGEIYMALQGGAWSGRWGG